VHENFAVAFFKATVFNVLNSYCAFGTHVRLKPTRRGIIKTKYGSVIIDLRAQVVFQEPARASHHTTRAEVSELETPQIQRMRG
jgi:hypothetical protein